MKLVSVAVLIGVLWIFCDTVAARFLEQDFGRVTWISGGTIHVQGKLGRHVLVPVGVCDWCKTGVPIAVTFRGLGKATLKPNSDTIRGKPVDALVLTDGTDAR